MISISLRSKTLVISERLGRTTEIHFDGNGNADCFRIIFKVTEGAKSVVHTRKDNKRLPVGWVKNGEATLFENDKQDFERRLELAFSHAVCS